MSADTKRKGVSFMNKKLNLLVILVGLLVLSLVLGSCDNGSGGGGIDTFRIRITSIPESVMDDHVRVGLFPANSTTHTIDTALAGRDTQQPGDDAKGADWVEFSMYNLTPGSKYAATAGYYDIAFINVTTSEQKVAKNKQLEVNQTNTFVYSDFKNAE
jgi:hypothetical protein